MNLIDYLIVAAYFIGLLVLGNLFKENKTSKDYFLGGNTLGWFPLSLSTMATQLSAISFISAPAFVGLKMNGGMKWLSFEFGVPLAMVFIMLMLFPPIYRSGVVSIYEFVEKRFDKSTRFLLSIVFQISRALATGVMVYTAAFIMQTVLNIDFIYTILLISVITIIYSWQGGMKAVVWGDTIQMLILFAGLVFCMYYGWDLLSAKGGFTGHLDLGRTQVLDYNMGLYDGEEYGLWPMIIGGFFLYASYYGCDQTQAQRMLSAKSEKTVRQLLLANGLLRFPVVLTYCIMGLIIGSLVAASPDFLEAIKATTQKSFPEEFAKNGIKTDLMLPVFILNYLPHGIIGLLIVGILSAAMSSLSSTINSLSAVTVEDFFNRGATKLSDEKYIQYSKYAVVFWGLVCIGCAFLFGGSTSPVIEIINAISSVFNGPVLATFVLAIFSKKVNKHGIKIGIVISVLFNLVFSKTMQRIFGFDLGVHIFWIWLNFTGFAMTVLVAYIISSLRPDAENKPYDADYSLNLSAFFKKEPVILVGYFLLILAFSWLLPSLF